MKLTDYPKVTVSGAPGWTAFDGWLITVFTPKFGDDKGVVCAEFDGKIETNVFDMTYVKEV